VLGDERRGPGQRRGVPSEEMALGPEGRWRSGQGKPGPLIGWGSSLAVAVWWFSTARVK
jgi:hypothetical protein